MFGLSSKDKVRQLEADVEYWRSECYLARRRYRNLQDDWNELVRLINSKGGERFLKEASLKNERAPLSKDIIKKMISLCHPDKHEGRATAKEVTQLLIKMRDES